MLTSHSQGLTACFATIESSNRRVSMPFVTQASRDGKVACQETQEQISRRWGMVSIPNEGQV